MLESQTKQLTFLTLIKYKIPARIVLQRRQTPAPEETEGDLDQEEELEGLVPLVAIIKPVIKASRA